MKKHRLLWLTIAYLFAASALSGCGESGQITLPDVVSGSTPQTEKPTDSTSAPASKDAAGTSARDNTPVCLVPEASGTSETRNEVAVIDTSHTDCGYIMADYTGSVDKVKIRITSPDDIEYTYDLHGNGYETFPLTSGDGSYKIVIYENISGTSYSTCLTTTVSVKLADEFEPFLYPNQYVNFNADSKVVKKGAELAANASTDLEVVENIYNYIISTISYDYEKASDPPTGYTSDVDAILDSGTGICLDYAAVMAAMLRSQQIPTRLEVGYAKDAYHAWISVYTEETGWLNGLVEITGNTWSLVDPTFGANSSESSLKKFIGDGSNYTLQKLY